ncbi:Protein BONZAI 3 [Capsicum baccatum]|uniref:Protein BONZAI 3 n=1 Tax=Capsicum baccatum TaxID=33114 RepID=A0A2G2WU62_CAPBA|nr:Protein BONZAI 3 [Capsicum baccatum]
MGNCLSHVKGGKQAVGGVGHHMDPAGAAGGGNGAAVERSNDAVDLFYRTKGLNALYIPIELSLSALKLRDLDIISKSDPMAVVSLRQRDGTLEDLGRTEVIMNNLDPVWVHFCCTNLWSRTVPCCGLSRKNNFRGHQNLEMIVEKRVSILLQKLMHMLQKLVLHILSYS